MRMTHVVYLRHGKRRLPECQNRTRQRLCVLLDVCTVLHYTTLHYIRKKNNIASMLHARCTGTSTTIRVGANTGSRIPCQGCTQQPKPTPRGIERHRRCCFGAPERPQKEERHGGAGGGQPLRHIHIHIPARFSGQESIGLRIQYPLSKKSHVLRSENTEGLGWNGEVWRRRCF